MEKLMRLTNSLRYCIQESVRALFKIALEKNSAELAKLRIGELIYESQMIPPAIAAVSEVLLAHPQYFRSIDKFSVTVILTDESSISYYEPTRKPIIAKTLRSIEYIQLNPDSTHYQTAYPLAFERQQIVTERGTTNNAITDLLNNIQNIDQLFELWPGVTHFVPKDMQPTGRKARWPKNRFKPKPLSDDVAAILIKYLLLK